MVFLRPFIEVLLLSSQHLRSIPFPIRPSTCILRIIDAVETEQPIASSNVQQTYWTELAVVITVMNCRFPKRIGIFDRKSTTSFSRNPPPYEVSMYTYFVLSKRTYLFWRKHKLILQSVRRWVALWGHDGVDMKPFWNKKAYRNSVEEFLGEQPHDGLIN
jgi:hypothetical protein